MAYYNDPYGVGRLKERELLVRERTKNIDLLTEQIAKELKSISERLQVLEAKM